MLAYYEVGQARVTDRQAARPIALSAISTWRWAHMEWMLMAPTAFSLSPPGPAASPKMKTRSSPARAALMRRSRQPPPAISHHYACQLQHFRHTFDIHAQLFAFRHATPRTRDDGRARHDRPLRGVAARHAAAGSFEICTAFAASSPTAIFPPASRRPRFLRHAAAGKMTIGFVDLPPPIKQMSPLFPGRQYAFHL